MRDETPIGLRRLRAFDAVARCGSLSAAAQDLRLSQPALTRSMARLEAELGVRLFERRPEGAFATLEGAIFRRRTDRFFDQMAEAVSQASGGRKAGDRLSALISTAQMRALLAIWRHGSFRAAARALALAEPSLQRPARELEQIIGKPLYKRTAAGLAVSDVGAELARRFALAHSEIGSAREEIGRSFAGRASLRIGVLALAPRSLLARATAQLLAQDHMHRVEVREGSYAHLVQELNNGGIDVLMGALRAPPPLPDLLEERLFEDPYAIVCRKGHPLLAEADVRAHDLAPYDWIFPSEGLPRRAVLNDFLKRTKLPHVVQFETSCEATISAVLTTSDRITILSRRHIELDGHHSLAFIDGLDVAHAPRFVGLTYRASWLPTPFQSLFLKEIRAACALLSEPQSCRAPGVQTGSTC